MISPWIRNSAVAPLGGLAWGLSPGRSEGVARAVISWRLDGVWSACFKDGSLSWPRGPSASTVGHPCRAAGASSPPGSWVPHKGNDPRDSKKEVTPCAIHSWKSALPPDSIWSTSLRTAHTQGERDWIQPWIWGHILKTPHHRWVSLPGHWLLSGREANKIIFWSQNAFRWALLLLSFFLFYF